MINLMTQFNKSNRFPKCNACSFELTEWRDGPVDKHNRTSAWNKFLRTRILIWSHQSELIFHPLWYFYSNSKLGERCKSYPFREFNNRKSSIWPIPHQFSPAHLLKPKPHIWKQLMDWMFCHLRYWTMSKRIGNPNQIRFWKWQVPLLLL